MTSISAPFPKVALIAFGTYIVLTLLIGEFYPFSAQGMYSQLQDYDEGSVLTFMADGEVVRLEDYGRFTGFEPGDVKPLEGVPFSMGFALREFQTWVERNRGDLNNPGSVVFEIGFRRVTIGDEGPEMGPFIPVVKGNAWPGE